MLRYIKKKDWCRNVYDYLVDGEFIVTNRGIPEWSIIVTRLNEEEQDGKTKQTNSSKGDKPNIHESKEASNHGRTASSIPTKKE